MFGIGTSEFLVILIVGVLVLGPEHLPKIMRTLTKVMSDFRRVSTDFQRTINLEANQEEWKREQSTKKTVKKKKKVRPAPESESVEEVPTANAAPAQEKDGHAISPPVADELAAEQTVRAASEPATTAADAQASPHVSGAETVTERKESQTISLDKPSNGNQSSSAERDITPPMQGGSA